MKGSIRQRSKGSWEITIDTGRDGATGKRLRHFGEYPGHQKGRTKTAVRVITHP